MFGSPDGRGTFPCNYRIQVHEATHVPPGVRSLSVAWKKGEQVVSTGESEVQDGCVQWGREIAVSCLLFRGGAVRDGQMQFEAKKCWLEVTRDGGATIGHAQLDLADFCDGQAHERVLKVWKGTVASVSIQLRVTIQASSAPIPRVVKRSRGYAYSDADVGCGEEKPLRFASKTSATMSPLEGRRSNPGAFPEDAKFTADLDVFLRGANLSPGGVTAQATTSPLQRQFSPHMFLPSRLACTPRTHLIDGPTSRYAAALEDLPARLVALCNRQCVASGLSSVQQDDAVRLFLAAYSRARDPVSSCGIIFSMTSPSTGIPAAASAPPAIPCHPAAVVDPPSNPSVTPPSDDPDPYRITPATSAAAVAAVAAASAPSGYGRNISTAGSLPQSLLLGTTPPPAIVDGVSHACTRDLYELLSHLSDIRSLAVALSHMTASSEQGDGALSPGAQISAAAAIFATAATEGHSVADGGDDTDGVLGAPAAENFVEGADSSGAPAAENFGGGADCGAGGFSGGLGGGSETPAVEVPATNHVAIASATDEPLGMLSSPSATKIQACSLDNGDADVVIAQILHGVDQVSNIGERALQEANEELGFYLHRLSEVSRDRDLWSQRFLAARELQLSGRLCERAVRLLDGGAGAASSSMGMSRLVSTA